MSVTGKRGVGIPIILMHDAEGTIVTVEMQNGDTYRGFLDETEDNMNCILKVRRGLDVCRRVDRPLVCGKLTPMPARAQIRNIRARRTSRKRRLTGASRKSTTSFCADPTSHS